MKSLNSLIIEGIIKEDNSSLFEECKYVIIYEEENFSFPVIFTTKPTKELHNRKVRIVGSLKKGHILVEHAEIKGKQSDIP